MGYIKEHYGFVYKSCLTYVTSKGEILPSTNRTDEDCSEQSNSEESDDENTELVEENDEIVERIVLLIQENKLSACQLEVPSAAFGKTLQGTIYESTKQARGSYKDLQKTVEESCMDLIRSKPKSLVNFSWNATNIDVLTLEENPRKLYSLCILIEHIEILRNPKYVGRLSFSEGLVKWNFRDSKHTPLNRVRLHAEL